MTGDKVLTQSEVTYDADGNLLLAATKDRFDSETATGELGDASTSPKARVSYTAGYYDAADRMTASVDVGTNGGSAYTRPGSAPARSNTELVTSQTYDAAGRNDTVTDPRGVVTRNTYDLLGRTTQTIAAYVDGTPSAADDQTTRYTYDGSDHNLTMQAVLPGSAHQTTKYEYGTSLVSGSSIASDDVLTRVSYPDKTTGDAGTAAADRQTYTYNALGEPLTYTDQNGTSHAYAYDVLGRSTADAATVASGNPQAVDTAVLRLETAYNSQGLPYLFTSYDAAGGGSVVNQVQDVYNGLGQLTTEYQAVSGAVNTSTTPKVQYAYTEMSGGANHSRPTSLTYPDGRVVGYNYYDALDAAVSRMDTLTEGYASSCIGQIESSKFLGLGTAVTRSQQNGVVGLTYVKQSGEADGDAGDQYTGLDRFGRVVDQRWLKSATPAPTATDRFQYGYDRDSDVLYKDNKVSSTFSELYHANSAASGDNAAAYDKLGRLGGFRRGTLSASGKNGSGSFPATTGLDTVSTLNTLAGSQKAWNLDALGNWGDTSGSGTVGVTTDGTTDSRTHNQRNQVTAVNMGAPTYNNNGDMTANEVARQLAYDAWDRLVGVKDVLGAAVESMGYDALGRRASESPAGGTATALYYSKDWQVLEERQAGAAKAQYVWSPLYVDALIERDRDADNNSATGSSQNATGSFTSGLEERLYAQQDANFNVTALTNTSGQVVERFAYDPYGADQVLDLGFSPTTDAYDWVNRFQGGRLQTATGTYDFRNRVYSPTLGRWMQTDPAGYVDGLNLYEALNGSPADNVDPLGLEAAVVNVPSVGTKAENNTDATTLVPAAELDVTYEVGNADGSFKVTAVKLGRNNYGAIKGLPPQFGLTKIAVGVMKAGEIAEVGKYIGETTVNQVAVELVLENRYVVTAQSPSTTQPVPQKRCVRVEYRLCARQKLGAIRTVQQEVARWQQQGAAPVKGPMQAEGIPFEAKNTMTGPVGGARDRRRQGSREAGCVVSAPGRFRQSGKVVTGGEPDLPEVRPG